MATPSRTSILLDIKSTLEKISTGNGYKTTVATVEPYLRTWDCLGEGEKPYIGFGFDRETYEHQSYHNMRVQVPWTVVGYLETQDNWTLASAAANNLIDDIIASVMSDDSLGSHGTQTLLMGSESNEADPDFERAAIVIVDFRTTYYRETTST